MTIQLKRPAVQLEGGPRHGFGYYLDDLEQQVRATEAMGRTFDYVPTGRKAVHPGAGGLVESAVWEHVSLVGVERVPEPVLTEVLDDYGRRGATAAELAAKLGKNARFMAARLRELVEDGVAESSGGRNPLYRIRKAA